MKKLILVDGNNLIYRSYYATAYNGNFMKNSKDFPTNALFGFTNMINKIILEEKPTYMVVAFDKGKTFRHDKYKNYKAGRMTTPDELKVQMPIAKQMLEYMGIIHLETDNFEADDIIGTYANLCDKEEDFIGTIVSSDKDLLQLISNDVDIKLLKSKDYIRYDNTSFKEAYGIDPINIIDLKALMGDPSDNIPGVLGIGEKTALKLLIDYKNLDGVYENLDKLSLKLKEKLVNNKDNAYLSYDLATIVKDVPLDYKLEDLKIIEKNKTKLNELYEQLEFYSFIKKDQKLVLEENIEVKVVKNIDEINITEDSSIYLELFGTNYHTSKILGAAIYNEKESFYIPFNLLKEGIEKIKDKLKITYDLKKLYVSLKWQNININNITFDTMIAAYLLEYNIKDDVSYLASTLNYDIPFYETVYNNKKNYVLPNEQTIANISLKKAKFIYDTYKDFEKKLIDEEQDKLFYEIEMPLAIVLGDMEYDGINIDKKELISMGEEIKIKIELVEKDIFNEAGCEFNISSPKQLGEILFDKLGLQTGKKTKTGYSTSVEILNKIKNNHPIIKKVLEYRMLTKLYSTYIEGLITATGVDNKIHTIYNQTLTRTGRLSSIEPNLQNIPIRYEYGKLIRKAFIPSKDSIIMSGDYSQIELRILSHIANVESLIQAFKDNKDIHTKTASDIFKVEENEVNSNMRRIAKAVNFGIIYGISSYGLSENLQIHPGEAKSFIDNYLTTYPGIKEYMDNTIEEAHKTGYVKTLMGRIRSIPELANKNFIIRSGGERIALNTPIQGTSADIIKKAMVEIYKEFKKENIKSKMILQVHDELIFDLLIEEKEKVTSIVINCMENICKLNVPIKIDIACGDNWYQAK